MTTPHPDTERIDALERILNDRGSAFAILHRRFAIGYRNGIYSADTLREAIDKALSPRPAASTRGEE